MLDFTIYYKFVFYYSGTAKDGAIISAELDGNSDEIHSASFAPRETLESLVQETNLLDLIAKENNQ